uniref:profilin-1-like n=1 Tax=Myxine glutinosa TaxID=7769 RepID=UPI0035902FDA
MAEGWAQYVESLMADGTCQDAAIAGCVDCPGVWSSVPGLTFSKVTPAELSALVGSERDALLTRGVLLGGARFSVIRDGMNTDQKTIDLRGRPGPEHPSVSLAVGRASSALVLVMGKEGVHGGNLNKKVAEMADHLRKSGL